MRILWSLDLEVGAINPDELLGSISIEHNGFILSDGPTFLDSWFRGLIQGYNCLREGMRRVEVDLVDEPHVLLFEAVGNGFCISYHNDLIPNVSLNDFYHALLDSSVTLLIKVEAESKNRDFTMIKPIIEFVREQRYSQLRSLPE
ncbi:MAG: hypothetical protein KJ063_14485 [Anaerolineae bacterium]|nr:hypothetical protein [Anaerolineae bacterium]